jgi:hypothetical protein
MLARTSQAITGDLGAFSSGVLPFWPLCIIWVVWDRALAQHPVAALGFAAFRKHFAPNMKLDLADNTTKVLHLGLDDIATDSDDIFFRKNVR